MLQSNPTLQHHGRCPTCGVFTHLTVAATWSSTLLQQPDVLYAFAFASAKFCPDECQNYVSTGPIFTLHYTKAICNLPWALMHRKSGKRSERKPALRLKWGLRQQKTCTLAKVRADAKKKKKPCTQTTARAVHWSSYSCSINVQPIKNVGCDWVVM